VRERVLQGLTREQIAQLAEFSKAVLGGLDPDRRLAGLYDSDSATG
jgi:hypothetical protein